MTVKVITIRDDRLDKICFKHYGTTASRQVENVLDSNPGLEKNPILLPEGLSIILPDMAVTTVTPTVTQIKLWE